MSNLDPTQPDYEIGPDGRPDFLITLGVLLPCSPEDVKQAYLAKVRSVHPDLGGSQQDFLNLQQAFERATEYAHFISGRRKWLGAQIERYAEQEEAVAYITATGGRVRYEHKEWLSREIGVDFAQVLDVANEIKWAGPQIGDEHLRWLLARQSIFRALRYLDLSDSQVTDDTVCQLGEFSALERLILKGTPVTHKSLAVLETLPALNELDIRDTRIGAMRLYFGRRANPDVEIRH